MASWPTVCNRINDPKPFTAEDLDLLRNNAAAFVNYGGNSATVVNARMAIESMATMNRLDGSIKQLDARGLEAIAAIAQLDRSIKELDVGNERLAKTTLRLSRVGIGVGIVGAFLAAMQVYYAMNPPTAPQILSDTPRSLPAAQPAVQPAAQPTAAQTPAAQAPSADPKKATKKAASKRGKQ